MSASFYTRVRPSARPGHIGADNVLGVRTSRGQLRRRRSAPARGGKAGQRPRACRDVRRVGWPRRARRTLRAAGDHTVSGRAPSQITAVSHPLCSQIPAKWEYPRRADVHCALCRPAERAPPEPAIAAPARPNPRREAHGGRRAAGRDRVHDGADAQLRAARGARVPTRAGGQEQDDA